jgi:hypothetical protein
VAPFHGEKLLVADKFDQYKCDEKTNLCRLATFTFFVSNRAIICEAINRIRSGIYFSVLWHLSSCYYTTENRNLFLLIEFGAQTVCSSSSPPTRRSSFSGDVNTPPYACRRTLLD